MSESWKFLWIILALAFPPSLLATPAAEVDLFAKDASWAGQRRFEKPKGLRHGAQEIWLRITSRERDSFEGILRIEKNLNGQDFEVAVSGKAPVSGDGPVNFKTTKAGDLVQSFHGRCKGGILALDFRGKSAGGVDVEGVASLRPGTPEEKPANRRTKNRR